ncbi:hypothetical protein Agub_g359, partial [Astrephomene gubernaculifera]
MPQAQLPDAAEAQRVLDALRGVIENVGEAYVELSGQTAAAQVVVADLRRCATFLQTRLEGEPPPPPWLPASTARTGGGSSGAAAAAAPPSNASTPTGRRAPFIQDSASAPSSAAPSPSAPPASFRSPSPARNDDYSLQQQQHQQYPSRGPSTPVPGLPGPGSTSA